MPYLSTKTYGHDIGLSACFRQWKASHSHCQYLHGYALRVSYQFEADYLDERNWVVDFGSLKELKSALQDRFDHKTLVARDDPYIEHFRLMHDKGLIDMVEVDRVGCEAFAEMAYHLAVKWVENDRVKVTQVEVAEHGSNSAIYRPD